MEDILYEQPSVTTA